MKYKDLGIDNSIYHAIRWGRIRDFDFDDPENEVEKIIDNLTEDDILNVKYIGVNNINNLNNKLVENGYPELKKNLIIDNMDESNEIYLLNSKLKDISRFNGSDSIKFVPLFISHIDEIKNSIKGNGYISLEQKILTDNSTIIIDNLNLNCINYDERVFKDKKYFKKYFAGKYIELCTGEEEDFYSLKIQRQQSGDNKLFIIESLSFGIKFIYSVEEVGTNEHVIGDIIFEFANFHIWGCDEYANYRSYKFKDDIQSIIGD